MPDDRHARQDRRSVHWDIAGDEHREIDLMVVKPNATTIR
jgi:hypothetical protein